MMTFAKKLACTSALLGLVAGCTNNDPGFEEQKTQRIRAQASALTEKGDVVRNGGSVDAGRPFLGQDSFGQPTSFEVDHGRAFPASLETADGVELSVPEPVGVDQLDLLLEELTGYSVVVRTRYQQGEEQLKIPINSRIRLNYRGPLSDLVEKIAADFDLAWEFDGEQIVFDRMPTRSYDVPLPASSGQIDTSLSGVNVGGNNVSSSKSITLDPWTELEESLGAIISEPASVTISRNSGRVTVFAPASVQRQAADIIEDFNDLYMKRIGVEVATFFVDTEKSAELGADIRAAELPSAQVGELSEGVVNALQGGIGVVSTNRLNSIVDLTDISSNGAVADYQMSNTVTQNGVVAPVVLTNSQDYVSRISTGGTDEGSEVETETINSGISVYALPRMMRNGKIQMSIWVTQSELNRLTSFDTGSGSVQLPDADQRAMEYTLIMEPGETLIMGGYEQERTESEDSGGWQGFGIRGNRQGESKSTRMVLMVRPSMLGN